MVDRIWRTLSSLRSSSTISEPIMNMSESSPFANPESMLQFSEYDGDITDIDGLSSNLLDKTLTNQDNRIYCTPQTIRKSDETERLLQRSNSDKMPKSNKIDQVKNVFQRQDTETSKKNLVDNHVDSGRSTSNSTLIHQTSINSTSTEGKKRIKKSVMVPFENSKPSLYFDDGKRQVDYVLAYEDDGDDDDDYESDNDSMIDDDITSCRDPENGVDGIIRVKKKASERKSERRKVFEDNLEKLGLELERHESTRMGVKFVLIHAPFKVLCKQAELMKIKMPVYQNDARKSPTLMEGVLNKFLKKLRFLDFNEHLKKRMEIKEYFSQPFVEQHLDCFVEHEDPQNFFPRTERSRMVYDFLIRTRYDKCKSDKFRAGIDRLLKSGTYSAAYPLHEDIEYNQNIDFSLCSSRQLLYECWVKMKNFYKYQPLHIVQDYFGTKIGFYFAWLGFYTRYLYFISFIGLICFIYGISTVTDDGPSNDICAQDGAGSNILICPSCDEHCDYIPLNSSCIYAKLTYVFDNTATIFFAAVMSIWATLFLEGWKRYHAEIAYKWNVHDLEGEDEVMRPEFQFRIKRLKLNPATQNQEPYLPTMEKCLRIAGSGVTVLFFLCLVIALVIGVIVYRAIVLQLFYTVDGMEKTTAMIITSVSAATINLIFILIMNHFYNMLALKLTDWECPRTQTEFENSYTLKVFLFQFINFYSSLFYIAFIKGRLSGTPGERVTGGKMKIDGLRLEECDPAGCMFELVVQLLIIMCGKQFFNGFMEIIFPILSNCFRRWHLRLPESSKEKKKRQKQEKQQDLVDNQLENLTYCERDYALNPTNEQVLFDEYLEMVIQFGFITLFVAAFPLAPLFALINNVLEIRLDAYKFLITARKPVPAQARNIGVWMTILDILSNLAVICNAFVIAFTSDFIPKIYYYYKYGTMDNYIEFSLSYYDATLLSEPINTSYSNITNCRYRDFRTPLCSINSNDLTPYHKNLDCSEHGGYSTDYWVILAYRFIFVIVFEHVVLTIKAIFAYIIPDVPTRIVVQIQRERYLARQAILQRQATNLPDEPDKPASVSTETKPADNEDIAIQPNRRYDGLDETPPPELTKIVARMSRRPSQTSRSSQYPEASNNQQLTGPRFRAIINKAAESRKDSADEINSIINDVPKKSESIDSFHTAKQGSNLTVNNAG